MTDDSHEDTPKKDPHWRWLLKHVLVPLLTAMIGAAGAGVAVKIQADMELRKEQLDSAIRSAASDAVLRTIGGHDRTEDPTIVIPPDVGDPGDDPPDIDDDPPSDDPPLTLDLPEDPPGDLPDYMNEAQMQQLEGDPVLIGKASERFREEWRRAAGELKGGTVKK